MARQEDDVMATQAWWRVRRHYDWPQSVEVDKETEACIYIAGDKSYHTGKPRRTPKESIDAAYLPTLRAALGYLLQQKSQSAQNLRIRIGRQEGMLREAEERLTTFKKQCKDYWSKPPEAGHD